MLELVTLDEARQHLRIDDYDSSGGPDDPWLSVFIPAISQAVAQWVKVESRLYVPALDSSGNPELDSNGDPIPALDSSGKPTPLPNVVAAVLIELERQFRSRGGEDGTNVESMGAIFAAGAHGYTLGIGSTALLYGLRKPTLA